jgi:hypothetical protein
MFSSDTERLISLVEEQTGYRVQTGTTDSAMGDAEMLSAAPGHPVHVINVSSRRLSNADYIIAVQCSMLLQMWSHPSGVPKFVVNDAESRRMASEAREWKGLSRLPATQAGQFAQVLVTGLLHQLRSTPAEILAIEFCRAECPSLKDAQTRSVEESLRRNSGNLAPSVKEVTPPAIYENSLAMNAALTRFWCDLQGNDLAMLPYRSVGAEGRAADLLSRLRACPGTLGERGVAAVDSWAEALGLRTLYSWEFRPK